MCWGFLFCFFGIAPQIYKMLWEELLSFWDAFRGKCQFIQLEPDEKFHSALNIEYLQTCTFSGSKWALPCAIFWPSRDWGDQIQSQCRSVAPNCSCCLHMPSGYVNWEWASVFGVKKKQKCYDFFFSEHWIFSEHLNIKTKYGYRLITHTASVSQEKTVRLRKSCLFHYQTHTEELFLFACSRHPEISYFCSTMFCLCQKC